MSTGRVGGTIDSGLQVDNCGTTYPSYQPHKDYWDYWTLPVPRTPLVKPQPVIVINRAPPHPRIDELLSRLDKLITLLEKKHG